MRTRGAILSDAAGELREATRVAPAAVHVRAVFTLILGRPPEPTYDPLPLSEKSFVELAGIYLSSDEFRTQALGPLARGEPIPAERYGAAPDPALLAAARGADACDFPDWRTFFLFLFRDDGAWRGAEKYLENSDVAVFAEQVARARFFLSRTPLSVAATGLDFEQPERCVARLVGFAPTPISAQVQLRSGAPSDVDIEVVAGPINWSETGQDHFAGQADLTFGASRDASAPLIVDVVSEAGEPLGPPLTITLAGDAQSVKRQTAAIEAQMLGASRLEVEAAIDALLAEAPLAPHALVLAVEDARARGRKRRLDRWLTRARLVKEPAVGRALARALFSTEKPAAVRLTAALAEKTTLDVLVAARASPQAQGAFNEIVRIADEDDEALRDNLAGLAQKLGLGANDAVALMMVLHAAGASPRRFARWIAVLENERARSDASRVLRALAPAFWIPTLSYLTTKAVGVDFGAVIGASRFAASEHRFDAALELAQSAVGMIGGDPRRREICVSALQAIPLLAARAAAVDLLVDGLNVDGLNHDPRETGAAIASLEAWLVARDPGRSPRRLNKAREECRLWAMRALLSAPKEPAVRREVAYALIADGRGGDGLEILASIAGADSHPAAFGDIAMAAETAERWDTCLQAAEGALSLRFDSRTALSKVRALRALGRAEEAGAFLDALDEDAAPYLRLERPRNAFFIADFDRAHTLATALADEIAGYRDAQMLAVAAAIEAGRVGAAVRLFEAIAPSDDPIVETERRWMGCAVARSAGDAEGALSHLNAAFGLVGCRSIGVRNRDCFDLDRLVVGGELVEQPSLLGPSPAVDGPLVSVVMTAYNAADFIETSVRSVLGQSYHNIELIIVDDASTDETPRLLRSIERADPRVRAIHKSQNDGTYVSKNTGLLAARGEIVALQDADDWSHPDRIAKSVAILLANPDLVGVAADWARMTSDGRIVFKPGGGIGHVCCISLVFRRRAVLAKAGFFDSVRVEADMEYIKRLRLLFGAEAVGRLRAPLLVGRAHDASLTADQSLGIRRSGYSPARLAYQAAYRAWHEAIAKGAASGFLPHPARDRLFPAPDAILPERSRD